MNLGSAGGFTMQIDYSDYGIRPEIEVPSESETFDVTPYLDQMLERSGG
jgi:hypothetical protein